MIQGQRTFHMFQSFKLTDKHVINLGIAHSADISVTDDRPTDIERQESIGQPNVSQSVSQSVTLHPTYSDVNVTMVSALT